MRTNVPTFYQVSLLSRRHTVLIHEYVIYVQVTEYDVQIKYIIVQTRDCLAQWGMLLG